MYSIKNDNEVYIYDSIEQGITARALLKALDADSESITLRINSGGGDVFEALALYNWLKGHECRVTVYVDGLCASAASVIAMAGDEIYMPSNALMMIHNPMGGVFGDASDMAAMSELLTKIRDSIAGIYATRTGLPHDEIIRMMESETWMNGIEAKPLGFVDYVTDAVKNESTLTYEDGVRAERERLRALDEINAPGRESVIARAKYETFQSVKDIAVDLLKVETRRKESAAVNDITASAVDTVTSCIDLLADKLNSLRGGH